MHLTIRTCTDNDIEALANFSAKSFSDTFGHLYSVEDLHAHLENKCSAAYFRNAAKTITSLLLYDGEALVGYSTYGKVMVPVPHEVAEGALELQRFYMDAAYHGSGAAQQLMDATLDAMAHAPEVYLGVWNENARAQKFYTRYGFHHIGNYTYYVGETEDDDWIMQLEHQTLRRRKAPA